MEQSLFIQYVQKWFKPLIGLIYSTVNGSSEAPTYMFKTFLKKEESMSLKWGSLESNGSIVMADVVALDSELPLKKRDSIQKASGDIPKMGMKYYLNERQLQELDALSKSDGKEETLVAKLFQDTKKAYTGILERLEFMFLQALSSGVTVINDAENVGLGVRIDFGVPEGNKFGAEVVWSDPTNAKPIDDIEKVKEAARVRGHVLKFMFLDKVAFDNFRKSDQGKQAYASYVGFTGTTIPIPNLQKVNEMLGADHGLEVIVVNRYLAQERNGVQTMVNPWTAGSVTFTTTKELGTLTYGDVAEVNHKVEGVSYEMVDDFVLLSKYRKNDPVREFSSSQANVVPVLNNVGAIYMLDTTEAQTIEGQTELDANITIYGQTLVKATVIAALVTLGYPTSGSITDVSLIKKINNLSDEAEAALKTALGI